MYVDPDPECDEEGWGEARSATAAVAVAAAVGGAYALTYGVDRYLTYADALGDHGELLQFGVIAALFVCHEALHAVAYLVFGDLSTDDIEVELAVFPEATEPLSHSVHPSRPVRRWVHLAGVAAPGVVLGAVPAAVALATGSAFVMFVGLLGLLLAGTDVGALVDAWRRPELVAAPDPAY